MREYEAQVSALTTSVAAQEEAARHADQEKHSILQDLSAVRDLCTKLEATKDSLQRQLAARTLDQEKVSPLPEDNVSRLGEEKFIGGADGFNQWAGCVCFCETKQVPLTACVSTLASLHTICFWIAKRGASVHILTNLSSA